MIRILSALIILLLLMTPAYGATLGSTELINNANKHSGKTTEYQGEAIGDVMKRGAYGWVNLNDGSNALGVWASAELLDSIKNIGDYNHKGGTVLVKGVFNQACSEHGGDIDIHATSLTVVEAGGKVTHPVNSTKAIAAALLALAVAVLFAVNRKRAAKPI